MKILQFWSRLPFLAKFFLGLFFGFVGLIFSGVIFLDIYIKIDIMEEKQLSYFRDKLGHIGYVLDKYYERYQKYPDSLITLTQVKIEEVKIEHKSLGDYLDDYKNPYRYFWNNTGLGNAYDDLEKYLPSLYSNEEGDYFLNDCNGKFLYQPMGKNNQDFILVGCVKNHRIYYDVYNSQGKSFSTLINTERKTIFYGKYYDENLDDNKIDHS